MEGLIRIIYQSTFLAEAMVGKWSGGFSMLLNNTGTNPAINFGRQFTSGGVTFVAKATLHSAKQCMQLKKGLLHRSAD